MRRDILVLLGAFAAIALAFVGATFLSQRAAREVGGLAMSIARDAAPGLAAISNVRGEVRRLQALIERQAAMGPAPGDTDAIDETRHSLDAHLAAFRALPPSGEELKLLSLLQSDIRAFDEAVERVLAHGGAGRTEQAADALAREVRPLADEAVNTAAKLIQLDARAAEDAALRIEEVHRRAGRVALQMDAVCVALTALAAWLALRAVRRAHRIQDENRRIVERRAEELEQFAGRVAHDVLSPLASVGLALGVAEKSGTPAQQSAAKLGMASLRRVRGIVDALLEFARSGARPDPGASAQVCPAVEGILEELHPQAEEAAAELRTEPIPHCAAACSPGVLVVILTNLLRNALKYLGDASERRVVLRVRAKRSSVVFEVEDSGPGLPGELGDRVFEPYVRGARTSLAKPGIGLGLATVKRLVVAHGGAVGTRRGTLGGALFWVELPRAEDSEQVGARPDAVMHP